MSVIGIGMFDGVHLGHQKLIREMHLIALRNNLQTKIVSFDPDPDEFFKKEGFRGAIYTLEQKEQYLRECLIDCILHIDFNNEISSLSPEEFIKLLINRIDVSHIVVGDDFLFGHKRSGDTNILKEICARYSIGCTVVERLSIDNKIISASRIRCYLSSGMVKFANKLLGRNYEICGTVVRGNRYATEIMNIPTANILLNDQIAYVKNGVYLANVILPSGEQKYGVMNLGARPSIKKLNLYSDISLASKTNSDRMIEVHIFDFNQDLYDQAIRVQCVRFIRPEYAFDNREMMINQLRYDVYTANILRQI